jgi:hypothetical protein
VRWGLRFIKSSPKKIIERGTDWRFLEEQGRKLKP